MLICRDIRTGAGCGSDNRNGALICRHCGRSLRYALELHDANDMIRHYRVVRVIGYGGFGAVYEAEDTLSGGQHVALKATFDPASIQAFQDECAALKRLQHPNLPRYHDFFEEQGNGYLVMEFVRGQSLADVLTRQNGPLVESQVLGYALQLCDVLSYIHAQNPPIIHRDVKPANVRLTPEGLVKLVDFGLLKEGPGATRSSRRAVTPEYAPLEQWSGGTDPRSDIYSLGATLYHLLTGKAPLPAPDRLATQPDPLPAPRLLNPTLSAHIDKVILTALAIQPQGRYPNALTFKAALSGVGAPPAKPTKVMPAPAPAPAPAAPGRRPAPQPTPQPAPQPAPTPSTPMDLYVQHANFDFGTFFPNQMWWRSATIDNQSTEPDACGDVGLVPQAAWLSVLPQRFFSKRGKSQLVLVRVNTSGLAPGRYQSVISFSGAKGQIGPITLEVEPLTAVELAQKTALHLLVGACLGLCLSITSYLSVSIFGDSLLLLTIALFVLLGAGLFALLGHFLQHPIRLVQEFFMGWMMGTAGGAMLGLVLGLMRAALARSWEPLLPTAETVAIVGQVIGIVAAYVVDFD